jgi:hypothetical protein
MPSGEDLQEFEMPGEIRKLVIKAGYKAPTLETVKRALKRANKLDPSSFGSESSRKTLVQDTAGLMIEWLKRAAKNRGEKRSPKGDVTSYPLGYEYAVLTAERIRPHIEDIRGRTWQTREVPFRTYEEATAWMRAQEESDSLLQRNQPKRINLTLELVFDDLEGDRLAMRDINKFPTSSDSKGSFFTWLEDATDALREATLHDACLSNVHGPTVKLESREEIRKMWFGSTTVSKSHVNRKGVQLVIPPGGLLDTLREQCEKIAEEIAPAWTTDDVFGHLLLGYLPVFPFAVTVDHASGKSYGFTYTFFYPLHEKLVLTMHRDFLHDAPETAFVHFKAQPKPLTEYELNLIDLTYNMPIQDFTWSQRLEAYLRRFDAEVKAGLLPDLGLGEERTKSSEKWKNAAGNLNRDYRNALKKFCWSTNEQLD